jgi:hypothetical protein
VQKSLYIHACLRRLRGGHDGRGSSSAQDDPAFQVINERPFERALHWEVITVEETVRHIGVQLQQLRWSSWQDQDIWHVARVRQLLDARLDLF